MGQLTTDRWRTVSNLLRFPLQAVNYFLFMALVGYFSVAPSYTHLDGDLSQVTLAFGHAGESLEPCRQLSPEELLKLAPNMRKPMDCPRERSPVVVELLMDGEMLLEVTANPTGLFGDGSVDIFRSVRVPTGRHTFEVRMNDNVRIDGYTHQASHEAELERARLLVVDFTPEPGFRFR